MEPNEIISELGLAPHPEGGHFAETLCDRPDGGGRARSSAIYYLLCTGERSVWHRIDAMEVWHHYAGAPILMRISRDGRTTSEHLLGPELAAGQRPQVAVPPNAWQTAAPLGPWALVGCTVAPAFEFAGFEMAPPAWEPG